MLQKATVKKYLDAVFALADEGEGDVTWKFRRKLIYGGYRLGYAMVVFGMVTFIWDREVSVQMVVGGVALISIILTAYTGFAAYEDTRLNKNELEP